VASTDYYYAPIDAMAQYGITAGCGSNDYCPTEIIPRWQMAIFLVRAIVGGDNFTYSTTPYFTDAPASYPYFKWIQKLRDLGITGGCGPALFCVNDNVTRAQMAIFIMRARYGAAGPPDSPTIHYFTDEPASDTTYFPWIQRMALDNITAGCGTGVYCPGNPVIRGDMAFFIMRGAFNQFLPASTPVVASISPATLPLGPVSTTYTITGTNTHWVQGTTTLNAIPGVTMGPVTVIDATHLTVQLTADAGALLQPYSILAITGSEEAVLPNGLNITPGTSGNLIANSGFEVPVQASGQFQYNRPIPPEAGPSRHYPAYRKMGLALQTTTARPPMAIRWR